MLSPSRGAPTFPHAAQRQRELPHEVIAGGAVVVLHHKAHQRQLRDLQLEGERLLPARVEAYGIASGWSLPREWGIVGAGWDVLGGMGIIMGPVEMYQVEWDGTGIYWRKRWDQTGVY